jgi:UDP-3-O-[3-hydroxymyristoyl] N-acetylglucosamine deacetylase
MDGLPQNFLLDYAALDEQQQTLKSSIGCVGIALHTGQRVSLTFRPAPPDHGIVFRRTDLGLDIPARFDCVTDTRLATVLSHEHDSTARVSTVEHVMAALAGCGIDNALVELDGPEPPILDGSAAPFVFLIDCAGIADQGVPRRMIEVRRTVRVSDGDAFAELRPSHGGFHGLDLAISIDFPARAIGRQALSLRLTHDSFRQDLARARTFVMAQEVEQVRAAGLGLGGSLDNAVVVDRADVLNPSGLRMADEFVRHKMLDAVGDLALAGAALRGRFIAHRSGHALNNRLLQALFADAATWQAVATEPLAA